MRQLIYLTATQVCGFFVELVQCLLAFGRSSPIRIALVSLDHVRRCSSQLLKGNVPLTKEGVEEVSGRS